MIQVFRAASGSDTLLNWATTKFARSIADCWRKHIKTCHLSPNGVLRRDVKVRENNVHCCKLSHLQEQLLSAVCPFKLSVNGMHCLHTGSPTHPWGIIWGVSFEVTHTVCPLQGCTHSQEHGVELVHRQDITLNTRLWNCRMFESPSLF